MSTATPHPSQDPTVSRSFAGFDGPRWMRVALRPDGNRRFVTEAFPIGSDGLLNEPSAS